MTNVLVIAEASGSSLKSSTLSAISFARKVNELAGGSFSILVAAGPGAKQAGEAARGFGAATVLVCEHDALTHYLAEAYAPTVAQAAADFDLVVATASSFGKDLIPRVAGRLEAAYAGDCSDVVMQDGKLAFKRPMFAGNAYGVVSLSTGK